MSEQAGLSRRGFLRASATAGGGLLLAFTIGCKDKSKDKPAPTPPAPAAPTGDPVDLDAWIHIDPDNTITLGIDLQREAGKAEERTAAGRSERYDEAELTRSLYGLYRSTLFESLTLTLGGRLDDFEGFGSVFTYRLTGALPLSDWGTTLRASYATGAKAPTIQQRFDDTFLFGFLPVRGNPDLEIERSKSWDIGIEQSLFDGKLVASATLFLNRFDDLIEFDAGAGTFLQIDEAETKGAELALQWRPLDRLRITGSYTHLRAEDKADGTALPRRPRHTGSVIVDFDVTSRASLQASLSLVGDRYNDTGERGRLDGYSLVNIAGTYEITDGVEFWGRIDNLFDDDYEEVMNLATAGRSAFAGLRARF